MPRCYACDVDLSNFETTRKIKREDGSISYPDLCNKCWNTTDLASFTNVVEREDLEYLIEDE
jgi:hypothetical protein